MAADLLVVVGVDMKQDALSHRIAIGRRFGERIAAGDAVFQSAFTGIEALPCTESKGVIKEMSGANSFVLLQVMNDFGWTDPRFFTLPQIREAECSLIPGAAGIDLQFLVSTGDDGLPMEVPVVKRFKVFHASDVEGIGKYAGKERLFGLSDFEKVAEQANGWVAVDGLSMALHNLVFDMQRASSENGQSVADMELRTKMAVCLLEIQAGFPFGNDGGLYRKDKDWVKGIEDDPLSFFRAIKDAEGLAAAVMVKVRQVAQEREAEAAVVMAAAIDPAAPEDGAKSGGDMRKGSARIEKMFQEREAVLAVPFAEKDRAAALGAVYYGTQKLWFVPKGLDVDLFKEWSPRSHALGLVATKDTLLASFAQAMESIGVVPPAEIIDDAHWHHVAVNTKKSGKKNTAGAYILNLTGARDGGAIGTIMNKDSGESLTWHYDGELLTPEQRARFRAEVLEREAAAAAETARIQDVAAEHAIEIWAAGSDVDEYGYAVGKGVQPEGLRQISGSVLLQYPEFHGESGGSVIRANENYLLVPMMDVAGNIRAVQAINNDGSVKSFMRGAQKKGTMLVLGAASFEALCTSGAEAVAYVEGWATGQSLRAASGLPVVVCFDAGNLETVAADTTKLLPQSMTVVLAVDNDQFHVERALGYLAGQVGLNPYVPGGHKVDVRSSAFEVRSVGLGEAMADGEWHQLPKGGYRMSLDRYEIDEAVRNIEVEVVPTEGRKMRAIFSNRGVEAGEVALGKVIENGRQGLITMPEFSSLSKRPTDWNDLALREGNNIVRKVLMDSGVKLGQAPWVESCKSLSQVREVAVAGR